VKRIAYIGDFIKEMDKQNLLEEFSAWVDKEMPKAFSYYVAIEQVIDAYPGVRGQALEDLKASKKIWDRQI
jgi:hypothetical protein